MVKKKNKRKKKRESKKKKKQGFFKENYLQSWDYIKESKSFIYYTIIIFIFFAIIGLILPVPEYISELISKFIKELLEKTETMSQFELITFIFTNNLKTSFYGLFFGILFGIIPLIGALANGYVVGVVSYVVVSEEGLFSLWRLFPHGIFELPAVFISLGLGLRLGSFVFQEKKIESLRYYFWNSLRVFLLVVVPLLIIAAIIEGSLIFLFD